MNPTPVPWDKRADAWLDEHPVLQLIRNGLAILALGWLFVIGILALSGWEAK